MKSQRLQPTVVEQVATLLTASGYESQAAAALKFAQSKPTIPQLTTFTSSLQNLSDIATEELAVLLKSITGPPPLEFVEEIVDLEQARRNMAVGECRILPATGLV